jgi:hypothetical protein
MFLTLQPKTRKGHNKLQNKFNKWKVIESGLVNPPTDRVLLLEVRDDSKEPSTRWVMKMNDPDFVLFLIEE